MTRIIGIRPGNVSALLYEVISVKVALITISVAISLRTLGSFSRVAPHVRRQVRVSVHHALVEHSHDDGRIAYAGFPSLNGIHITSSLSTSLIIIEILEAIVAGAQIAIVPLISEAWVVRFTRCSRTGCLLLKRLVAEIDALAIGIVGTLDATIGLHLGNFAQLLQALSGSLQVGALVKLHGVPEVESRLTGSCLGVCINREDTLEAVASQDVEHLVGRRNTRTGSLARTSLAHLRLVENAAHLWGKLDEQLTSLCIRRDGDVCLALRRVDG